MKTCEKCGCRIPTELGEMAINQWPKPTNNQLSDEEVWLRALELSRPNLSVGVADTILCEFKKRFRQTAPRMSDPLRPATDSDYAKLEQALHAIIPESKP